MTSCPKSCTQSLSPIDYIIATASRRSLLLGEMKEKRWRKETDGDQGRGKRWRDEDVRAPAFPLLFSSPPLLPSKELDVLILFTSCSLRPCLKLESTPHHRHEGGEKGTRGWSKRVPGFGGERERERVRRKREDSGALQMLVVGVLSCTDFKFATSHRHRHPTTHITNITYNNSDLSVSPHGTPCPPDQPSNHRDLL